jgi:hypothetical protein
LEAKINTITIFLDLSEAFDTINHLILFSNAKKANEFGYFLSLLNLP